MLLAFDEDVGLALKQVRKYDYNDEAMILLRAVKIVRPDVLNSDLKIQGWE